MGRGEVLLFALAWLVGCSVQQILPPSYDLDALGRATNPDEVRAAMPPDAELLSAWTCDPLPEPLTVTGARDVHRRCALGGLSSEDDFARASGDRAKAALLYTWLNARQVAAPERIAVHLLGAPRVPNGLVLPRLDAPAGELPAITPVTEALTGGGTWGRYPYWHLPGLPEAEAVALDAKLPVDTLRYLLASLRADGRPLPLVVEGEQLSVIALAAPGEAPAERIPWGEGPVRWPAGEGPVRLEAPGDATVGDLLGRLASAPPTRRIELAIDFRPCGAAPGPGMVCHPGQGALETFWVDAEAVADDAACRAAQVCRSPAGTWDHARELCSFRGKRLPTRWEAERAGLATQPVWTATWAGPGEAPWGHCDGAPLCLSSTQKLLSDGSARNPGAPLKTAPVCATSEPFLTHWPPAQLTHPPPVPPLPEAPTAEEKAIIAAITSDTLEDKGICGEEVRQNWRESLRSGGRSTTTCRDPYSYVTSNEPKRQLWEPFLRNLGGAYVGVGSDQSYDFLVEQRASWAFVYDYDPNVVRLHQTLQPLVRAAATRQELVGLFAPAAKDRAADLIEAAYAPELSGTLVAFYNGYRGRLERHYQASLTPPAGHPDFGWLATDENYAYFRLLSQQGRVVPVGVDLLDDVGLRSVADACRNLGVPVRVYYTSNAPTAWGGQATAEYKGNVRSLPMDDRSIVLATFNSGAWSQDGHWHYNVMYGLLQQERLGLPTYDNNKMPIWDRIPGDHGSLTVVGLPTARAAASAP